MMDKDDYDELVGLIVASARSKDLMDDDRARELLNKILDKLNQIDYNHRRGNFNEQ